MNKLFAVTLTAALATASSAVAGARPLAPVAEGAPAISYLQDRSWDTPPSEYDEISRKGFHDGIEGARKDYENHRRPDPHNRDEFRHPSVPHHDRETYRQAFERGYQVGVDHMMHGH